MKMNLQAKHLELTDAIRDYAEKKLGELDKFIPEGTLSSVDISLERTTNHHKKGDVFKAESNISVPGTLLNAESEHENLYAAIDLLKDEMTRELKRYKDRLHTKMMKGARADKEDSHMTDLAK